MQGATVYNLDMSEKFSREENVDMPADNSTRLFTLPDVQDLSPTYFLKLILHDQQRPNCWSNFYWISTTHETIDWAKIEVVCHTYGIVCELFRAFSTAPR